MDCHEQLPYPGPLSDNGVPWMIRGAASGAAAVEPANGVGCRMASVLPCSCSSACCCCLWELSCFWLALPYNMSARAFTDWSMLRWLGSTPWCTAQTNRCRPFQIASCRLCFSLPLLLLSAGGTAASRKLWLRPATVAGLFAAASNELKGSCRVGLKVTVIPSCRQHVTVADIAIGQIELSPHFTHVSGPDQCHPWYHVRKVHAFRIATTKQGQYMQTRVWNSQLQCCVPHPVHELQSLQCPPRQDTQAAMVVDGSKGIR